MPVVSPMEPEVIELHPFYFRSTCIAWMTNKLFIIAWCVSQQYIGVMTKSSVASYPGCVGGEKWHGIDCLRMRDHAQKTWESVYVWKLSVKPTRIRRLYLRIIERCSRLSVGLSMKVEDNRRVYEGEDAFSSAVLVGLYATRWASELGIGRDSYAVFLLVSPLVSLTITISVWVSVVLS